MSNFENSFNYFDMFLYCIWYCDLLENLLLINLD